MTLRFSERYLIVVNALLVVALAYFAAVKVNDVIAWSLASSEDEQGAEEAATRPSNARRARAYYEPILRRDIFNLRPAPAPVATAQDLRVRLLGTSLLTLEKPFAIIEDQAGRQGLYRVGEEVPGAGRLVAVERNRAILDRGGRRVAIEIPDSALPTGSGSATAGIGPGGIIAPPIFPGGIPPRRPPSQEEQDIRPVGPNHFAIKRDFVNDAFMELGEFAEEVQLVPHVVSGKMQGLLVRELEEASIASELGLKNGDIITHIDGRAITDSTRALAMIPMLRTRDSVKVDVVRNGKRLTYRYDLR
jgi:type II secretion system protein C